jgi:hypothetical protein
VPPSRRPPILRDAVFWATLAPIALVLAVALAASLLLSGVSVPRLAGLVACVALSTLAATMLRTRYDEYLPHRRNSDVLGPLRLHRTRDRRLRIARHFLPLRPPPGWSVPIAPKAGGTVWRVVVGNVHVLAWCQLEEYGPHFCVAMAYDDRADPVPHARAAEILAHFREVTEFMECAELPPGITLPGVRCWTALNIDYLDAVHAPRSPERVVEPPFSEQRELLRRFLPDKLPFGWSPYLATQDTPDQWQILDDDVAMVVGFVTTEEGVKLAVTLFRRDQTPIELARAKGVLEHFRNVREFVQIPVEDLPHARMFLGRIDARAEARDQPN